MIPVAIHSHQTALINPKKLTMPIEIIGCGSIGSWTAVGLTKMGCSNLILWDADTVQLHNLGSQFYTMNDVGKKKVIELGKTLHDIQLDTQVAQIPVKWTFYPLALPPVITICAVDSIETRKAIYKAIPLTDTRWFIDGRMGGNIITIYAFRLSDKEARARYKKTLLPKEKMKKIPCSEKSVVYNCLVISGLITDIVAHIANGKPVPFLIDVDLQNFLLHTDEIKI